MLEKIFPITISRSLLGFSPEEREDMRVWAMSAYDELNAYKKPWGRVNRISLVDHDPRFAPLFTAVQTRVETELTVSISGMSGREIIQFAGDFLPPHVEETTLSAIYWVSVDVNPDPKNQDYSGCLVLQHPAGPFGSKTPPSEMRVHMLEPKNDMLLVFPSHLLHFTHIYRSANPNVAIHFEIELS